MRKFTQDPVIEGFKASGTVDFEEADVKPKTVFDLIRYTGKYIGVGAARKMGHGRFVIVE